MREAASRGRQDHPADLRGFAASRCGEVARDTDRVARGVGERPPHELKKEVHGLLRSWGIPSVRYRIFECSGTPAGQTLAFALLARAATLLLVGFTPKSVELRFSNLMAFDATVHGSWGCPPEAYPEVLRLIYEGRVVLEPFLEPAPMSRLNKLLDDMAHHRLSRRMVLDPRS